MCSVLYGYSYVRKKLLRTNLYFTAPSAALNAHSCHLILLPEIMMKHAGHHFVHRYESIIVEMRAVFCTRVCCDIFCLFATKRGILSLCGIIFFACHCFLQVFSTHLFAFSSCNNSAMNGKSCPSCIKFQTAFMRVRVCVSHICALHKEAI